MSKSAKTGLELFFYAAAALIFFWLRSNFLPYWWADFNADYALVGVMAQETLRGSFPIFYYGQNYMGGLEWLTAAAAAKLWGASTVSLEILRWNSLAWWFLAGAAWVLFLRRISVRLALGFAALFAFGNYVLLQVSTLQELSPQYLFFGALVAFALREAKDLRGARGAGFGALLGFAWWTNQSVVFFFVPALLVYHAIPGRWWQLSLVQEFVRPVRRLYPLYALAALLIVTGTLVALGGGFRMALGSGHLKIPNGVSMARDAVMVLVIVQAIAKFLSPSLAAWRRDAFTFARAAAPFVGGFLLGYGPVWLGRILGLYEKNYGVALSIIPLKGWPAQVGSLLRSFDELFFSSLLQRNFGALALPLVGIVVVGILALGYRLRRHAIARFALGVFVLNAVYVFLSDRSLGAPVRYLYPTLVAFWLILLLGILSLRSRALATMGVAALVLLAGLGARAESARLMDHYLASDWRRENLLSVMQELERRNFHHCWGDYWTAYLLTYLTEERIAFSPHPLAPDHQIRMRKTHEEVNQANPRCFISRKAVGDRVRFEFSEVNPWSAP